MCVCAVLCRLDSSFPIRRMSSVHSPWGSPAEEARRQQVASQLQQQQQLANLPAALLSTLKREKKPFTYTPGGVNLSEVLEARLQKRMERKKRYYDSEAERPTPPRQVVVMPTYNTPLELYSTQNALEALELQVGLGDGSSPSRSATLPRNHTFRFDDSAPDRGVAQSKAFRVLQIMTDTEEDAAERCGGRSPCHQQGGEETRFAGLRDSGSIPSRFFHTLQKITGTTEEDNHGPQRTPPPPRTTTNDVLYTQGVQEASPAVPSLAPPQSGYLRRPADFLPSKASPAPGFRPVRPHFVGQQHRATVSGSTDF